ncbi:hypothetical protein B0H17DRAFT_1210530 [Mycena rosella]|uniref:MYND-type domain-containing protein n=1 Tax=Mycena rosella TaxID=1033263 RepID=A0AAD7CXA8_MYCRO|nr:hypothetical protein B0H17DRAFT_1210530 [Mycena rosella]
MFERFHSTPLWEQQIVPHLVAAWPLTQLAIQLHARLVLDKSRPHFDIDVNITRTNTFNSILVRRTPAVVDIVINLWAVEVRNDEIQKALAAEFPTQVAPPGASVCLNRFAFTVGDGPENTIEWGPLFAGALGGTLATGTALVLDHIHATLARASPTQTGTDLQSTTERLTNDLRNLHYFQYTPMRDQLLAQQSVETALKALAALTARPFKRLDDKGTAVGVVLVCDYLRQHIADDGLTFVIMAVESGLLRTLLKCYPWLEAKTIPSWTQFLCERLPKYMLYISVLRLTLRSLASIDSLGLDKPLGGAAAASWTAFKKQCTEPGTQLYSRCLQTSYCSRACQVAAWGSHKSARKTREKARAVGTGLPLSAEDIAFAYRIAQNGFEQRRAQIREEIAATRPRAPIRVELDYTEFPPALTVGSFPAGHISALAPAKQPVVTFHADFARGKHKAEHHLHFLLALDEDVHSALGEAEKAVRVLQAEIFERMYGIATTCPTCICLPNSNKVIQPGT